MSTIGSQGIYQTEEYKQELAIQRTFMARVFGWMTIGLLVTALVSVALASTPGLQKAIVGSGGGFIVLILIQVGVAMAFSFLINRIPASVAAGLFLLYSVITGAVFSILFLVYTSSSIGGVFFITAGMFGTTAVIGYTTKRDLSGMGSMLMMGLIGLVIASVVNIFMHSSGLYWLISLAGVAIFTGLTAYDTQKIKQAYATGQYGSQAFNRTALFGAFVLYLDFINLFLFLVQLLGSRRD